LGLAVRTDSHQLKQVVIDPKSGLTGHLSNDRTDVLRPGEFDGLLAGAADDVVAVGKICPDVTVTVVVLVHPADAAQIGQESQRPIDRHQPDSRAQGSRPILDVFGLEGPTGLGEDLQDGLPRLGEPKPGLLKYAFARFPFCYCCY
jgi:hypothetical protein